MNSNSVDLNALVELGKVIQIRRKELGVYLRYAADCACISRATLHRIEKGKPSVSIRAYMRVCKVLGLQLFALEAPQEFITPKVTQIAIFDANRPDDEQIAIQLYPQLKELVWQFRDLAT
jgi:transcriptional regulator with XRE-family HTH domain